MQLFSYKSVNGIGFLLTILTFTTAMYLQTYGGLQPCPLCIIQRVFLLAAMLIFFFGLFYTPKRGLRQILSGLGFLFCIGGAFTALRQVWLQHLPADQVPTCGPGLDILLKMLPLNQAIKEVFQGSGDCAQLQWVFMGLSLAEWSLGLFVVLGILFFIQIARR